MGTVNDHRLTVRIPEKLFQQLSYWADLNQVSINDYVQECIEHKIRFENKDYDLPVLEVQRLNQLIDAINVLSSNVQSLEHITSSGFDSLLGLARGDNYLLEDEEGDE